MVKHLILLVLIFLTILAFAFNDENFLKKNPFTAFSQTKLTSNKIIEIKAVNFDKDFVVEHCQFADKIETEGETCGKENAELKVSTLLKKETYENLTYFYTVSGGRIIGEGKNITWSFLFTRPGKHTISVGVGRDNVIYSNIITKTIELNDCICHEPPPVCECPNVKITAPQKEVKQGDTIIIKAKVTGREINRFVWKVSEGSILIGQGTEQIMVKTPENLKKKLLKVDLQLNLNNSEECECPLDFSKEIKISDK